MSFILIYHSFITAYGLPKVESSSQEIDISWRTLSTIAEILTTTHTFLRNLNTQGYEMIKIADTLAKHVVRWEEISLHNIILQKLGLGHFPAPPPPFHTLSVDQTVTLSTTVLFYSYLSNASHQLN